MQTIILDTNFILTALKYKLDIISELNRIIDTKFEIAVLDKTLHELKGKKLGKLALELINRLKFKVIKTHSKGYVDSILLTMRDSVIATQDKELKEKLKNRKITVITVRQKKYLIFD